MQYRKKPVVIDADQWLPNDLACRESAAMISGARVDGDKLLIDTFEGTMTVSPNDWIIRGIRGEYYPCKPDIFEATYEPVPQEKEDRCQTTHNTQSTSATQIADEMDHLINEYSIYWTGHIAKLKQWSRQLRTI